MLPTPNSLICLIVISAVFSLFLTWVTRKEWYGESRLVSLWKFLEQYFCLALMISMMCAATLQITSRYILAGLIPEEYVDYFLFPWTEEFSRLTMVWLALIGAAMVQREDEHISMTALFDVFPKTLQIYVRIFGDIVIISVLIVLAWIGWETSRGLDIMLTIEMGFPLSVFAYPIPFATSWMIIHTSQLLYKRVRSLSASNHITVSRG